jgi:hypothetical protein
VDGGGEGGQGLQERSHTHLPATREKGRTTCCCSGLQVTSLEVAGKPRVGSCSDVMTQARYCKAGSLIKVFTTQPCPPPATTLPSPTSTLLCTPLAPASPTHLAASPRLDTQASRSTRHTPAPSPGGSTTRVPPSPPSSPRPVLLRPGEPSLLLALVDEEGVAERGGEKAWRRPREVAWRAMSTACLRPSSPP